MQLADGIATANSATNAGRPGDPCVMVIFGATGDLTKRLLMPSLYNMARNKLLPENFAIVGFARGELGDDAAALLLVAGHRRHRGGHRGSKVEQRRAVRVPSRSAAARGSRAGQHVPA